MADNNNADEDVVAQSGGQEGDTVDDAEALYRRAPKGCIAYEDGKERISTTAFNDRNNKPSVDRAKLRNSPEDTKHAPTDGIIELSAAEVRGIRDVEITDPQTQPPTYYVVDVVPRPVDADEEQGIKENPAHAQIEATPHADANSRFRKIKEALAVIANQRGWLIRPQ
ncbi:hypothetical protein [Burkholderia cepacia]|uniref:hypothetical protein n=1 Tax=Burkholderia cepacia TaxID=292 RepID=UPI00352716C4